MHFWAPFNRALYRLYALVSYLVARVREPRQGRVSFGPGVVSPSRAEGLLWIAWGRIGDTVLATAVTRRLRSLFEVPVTLAGRAEVQDLVADHVDHFVPLTQISGEYRYVIGDIHLFHGGGCHLNGIIDAISAERKFVYEGYAPRHALAPFRPWPRSATLIPSLAGPGPSEGLEARHVHHHLVHYMTEILRQVGIDPARLDAAGLRPQIEVVEGDIGSLLDSHGLVPESYVVCQPISNHPRKDWPLARWREVIEAFPEQRFVLLGAEREARWGRDLALANVLDLRGETTLTQAVQVIGHARLFVGLDSGLTHVAACLGRPTVCVTQSSNLGSFFPYPESFGFERLQVVRHPEYDGCAGCFSVCEREPIWNTWRRGALCLRQLPASPVIAALAAALEQPTPRVPAGAER